MTAITYTDGIERDVGLTYQSKIVTWVSPATADSDDTVVFPAITGRNDIRLISCWDNTTGDAVNTTIATSTRTVTLDVGGGTTDHVYVVTVLYK